MTFFLQVSYFSPLQTSVEIPHILIHHPPKNAQNMSMDHQKTAILDLSLKSAGLTAQIKLLTLDIIAESRQTPSVTSQSR